MKLRVLSILLLAPLAVSIISCTKYDTSEDISTKSQVLNDFDKVFRIYFTEPACQFLPRQNFHTFSRNIEEAANSLVQKGAMTAGLMDSNVEKQTNIWFGEWSKSACTSELKLETEQAFDISKNLMSRINSAFKNASTQESQPYHLFKAMAKSSYRLLSRAWYLETRCRILSSERNVAWQSYMADITIALKELHITDPEIKAVQTQEMQMSQGLPCDENTKQIIKGATAVLKGFQ